MRCSSGPSSSEIRRELVRLVDKQLSVGLRFGFVEHLADARQVAELLPAVEDPFARCSFRSMYAWALTARRSDYAEGPMLRRASSRRCHGVPNRRRIAVRTCDIGGGAGGAEEV